MTHRGPFQPLPCWDSVMHLVLQQLRACWDVSPPSVTSPQLLSQVSQVLPSLSSPRGLALVRAGWTDSVAAGLSLWGRRVQPSSGSPGGFGT